MNTDKHEKLKKLLRLARNDSATPAESAAALRKAMALAAEIGIDPSSVDTSAPSAALPPMSHFIRSISKLTFEDKEAIFAIKLQFGIKVVTQGLYNTSAQNIFYIGPQAHIEVASYCHIYMVKSARRAWTKRTNKRLKDRKSFLTGYFMAIRAEMPEVFRERSIAYKEAIEAHAVTIFGENGITNVPLKKAKKQSQKSLISGWQAGTKSSIRNALPA